MTKKLLCSGVGTDHHARLGYRHHPIGNAFGHGAGQRLTIGKFGLNPQPIGLGPEDHERRPEQDSQRQQATCNDQVFDVLRVFARCLAGAIERTDFTTSDTRHQRRDFVVELAVQLVANQHRSGFSPNVLPHIHRALHQLDAPGHCTFQCSPVLQIPAGGSHRHHLRQGLLQFQAGLAVNGQVRVGSGQQVTAMKGLGGLEVGHQRLQK